MRSGFSAAKPSRTDENYITGSARARFGVALNHLRDMPPCIACAMASDAVSSGQQRGVDHVHVTLVIVPRGYPNIAAMVASNSLRRGGSGEGVSQCVRRYIPQTGAFSNPVPGSRQVAKRLAVLSSSEYRLAFGVLRQFFEQVRGSLTNRTQAIAILRPGKTKLAVLLINLIPHESGDFVTTAAGKGEQSNCVDAPAVLPFTFGCYQGRTKRAVIIHREEGRAPLIGRPPHATHGIVVAISLPQGEGEDPTEQSNSPRSSTRAASDRSTPARLTAIPPRRSLADLHCI